MNRELYELLVEGEALYFSRTASGSLLEAAETYNQLYHAAGYEWACKVIESLGGGSLRVLDAASGTGYGSARMAELPCVASVLGIDLNPSQLAYARQRHGGPKIEFMRGDVTHLDTLVPRGAIDVAVSFQTVEHLFDSVAFIAGVHQSMARDGVFLVGCPTHDETIFLNPDNPYHLVEYSQDLLCELLSFFFSRVRFFDELPHREVFDHLNNRLSVPNANYAVATEPYRRVSRRKRERFRTDYLLRLWRSGVHELQQRAIQARRERHFLTKCYTFLDLEEGFYPPELTHIWMKERAALTLTVESEPPRCGFTVVPAAPDVSEDNPVTVRLTDAKGDATDYRLTKHQGFKIELECIKGPNRIQLEVDRTWVPAEDSDTVDIRRLGLRLSGFWVG